MYLLLCRGGLVRKFLDLFWQVGVVGVGKSGDFRVRCGCVDAVGSSGEGGFGCFAVV